MKKLRVRARLDQSEFTVNKAVGFYLAAQRFKS